MRGGTSKGVFFHERDLPADTSARDRVLLRVLGSPDSNARQLDGMGGGISSLSKAVIIGPSTRADADIDYTFAQVAVDRSVVDYKSNCGNLSSAVGPFCIDEGLIAGTDGETLVRIHNTNTNRVVHARFEVRDGVAVVEGEFELQGVAGRGAPVRLEFLEPGGAITGKLLPSDTVVDELVDEFTGAAVTVSLFDASNATLFIEAASLGLLGTELPDAIETDGELMASLERLRGAAGVRMGLATEAADVPLSNPKIAIVSQPADYATLDGTVVAASDVDLVVRAVSMERIHRAVPLTTGMSIAAAALYDGTLAAKVARIADERGQTIRVGHPSGVLVVGATVEQGEPVSISKTAVYRTARRLMEGAVLVPKDTLENV